MKRFFKRLFCLAVFHLTAAGMAFAQIKDASSMLSTALSETKKTVTPIINIASIVIGLVGVVSLIVAYSKHAKADPSTQDALMKVGYGLLITIILMQVIRVMIF